MYGHPSCSGRRRSRSVGSFRFSARDFCCGLFRLLCAMLFWIVLGFLLSLWGVI